MAVQATWDNDEKTIVRYDFDAKWTWDDFYEAYYQAVDMQNSVLHRVDVILDMSQTRRLPDSALLHLRNLSEKQPPNIGKSILVSKNSFIISLYTLAMKNHAKIAYYFRLAGTLIDAHTLIEQDRAAYELESLPSY
jgi:hypothetical protein